MTATLRRLLLAPLLLLLAGCTLRHVAAGPISVPGAEVTVVWVEDVGSMDSLWNPEIIVRKDGRKTATKLLDDGDPRTSRLSLYAAGPGRLGVIIGGGAVLVDYSDGDARERQPSGPAEVNGWTYLGVVVPHRAGGGFSFVSATQAPECMVKGNWEPDIRLSIWRDECP